MAASAKLRSVAGRFAVWLAVAASTWLTGCSGRPKLVLVPPPSSPAAPAGVFRAGFGRSDLTPPPGLGLLGYGPEGQRAVGYRNRLHARALYLEDAFGEKLALVVADLGQIAPLLRHRVAELTAPALGIGADRLFISATHTHSGPGHFTGIAAYDAFGASVIGYDPAVTRFLAAQIADALAAAVDSARPAQAAWGRTYVWGATRLRSACAALRNDPIADAWRDLCDPADDPELREPLTEEQSLVNPLLHTLRVDLLNDETGRFEPTGAFSIFAVHGTGYPSANTLYDGDIQAVATRRVEQHIDALNGFTRRFLPASFHLLANGAEGDVSPDWDAESRNAPPELKRLRRPGGPKTPGGNEGWVVDRKAWKEALRVARVRMNEIGLLIGRKAAESFDDLDGQLRDTLTLGRVVETIDAEFEPDLCNPPEVGTVTSIGAEDGFTRMRGWKLLGFIPMSFGDPCCVAHKGDCGSCEIDEPRDECHGVKKRLLGGLHNAITKGKHLPAQIDLAAIRIGDKVLAAVPSEVTTNAGWRMQTAIARALSMDPHDVIVLGLTNGYTQYVVTEAEYATQCYEGSSTIYGPKSAQVFTEHLAGLASRLPGRGQPSPPDSLACLKLYPMNTSSLLPSRDRGPEPEKIERSVIAARIGPPEGDGEPTANASFVARWIDAHPGRLFPADQQVLCIQRMEGRSWADVAWDDDLSVEVRARRKVGGRGYLWEVLWTPEEIPSGDYRVRLLARPGLDEVTGPVVHAP